MKLKKLFVLLLAVAVFATSPLLYGCGSNSEHQEHEHKLGSQKYLLFDIDNGLGYTAFSCKKCEKTALVESRLKLTNDLPSIVDGDFTLTVENGGVYSFDSNGAKATVVSIHTKLQTEYLKSDGSELPATVNGKDELSKPLSVKLSWTYAKECSEYEVTVFDPLERPVFSGKTAENEVEIFYLEAGKKYSWRVTAKTADSDVTSKTAEFHVSSSCPRNVAITAVTNCRDIGGWITENGSRVKQGMIFRTAKLDNLADERYAQGINDIEALGIKTEIDLRGGGHNDGDFIQGVLGDRISYKLFSMTTSNIIKNEENLPSIKAVFETFADGSAYPMIFHCSIGTDRTGAIAFLLNGLLGVSEELLCYDYMFSAFGTINGTRSAYTVKQYAYTVREYGEKDDKLSTCIYNYLVEAVGVEEDTLDKVIDIMTE